VRGGPTAKRKKKSQRRFVASKKRKKRGGDSSAWEGEKEKEGRGFHFPGGHDKNEKGVLTSSPFVNEKTKPQRAD